MALHINCFSTVNYAFGTAAFIERTLSLSSDLVSFILHVFLIVTVMAVNTPVRRCNVTRVSCMC